MFRNLLIVLLMAFAAIAPIDASAGGSAVNIIYTGALHGELEPCGCSPKNQSGGLTRLAAFVSLRKTALSPYLLVDAGNSMAGDTPQGRLKVEAMLGAYNIIGYDAVAFLGSDTSLPKAFLTPLIDANKVPAVFEGGGRVVERGGLKINISANGSAPRPGMLNILLTEMPVAEAALLEGWQVIITSSGEVMAEPRLRPEAKGGVVVSAWPKGERFGILTIDVDKAGDLKSVSHRWEALAMDAPEDARVRGVLLAYDEKVAALLKDEERKAASDGPYLGAEACAACHQPFAEQWRATRHSGAFKDLERVGKSKDPECVKCHTTGYGLEGGFYSKTTTPGLAGVQCEVCHGPGRGHVMDFSLPMRPVDESLCRACHTRENSPEFDFKTYFEKIRHE
ncbi:MAG: hypothetical protein HZB85_06590 [Deltaproteobacteria bacterium]|nr:hypothetical protein [Deltaproteobacteria bacterium]